jgi:hypothetical protein
LPWRPEPFPPLSAVGFTLAIGREDLAGLRDAVSAQLGPDVTLAFRFAQLTPVTVIPATASPQANAVS